MDARPDRTTIDPLAAEPPAPRWSGSAAVPPPPPRRRSWGESAEPTPPPPAPLPPPESLTPVDPWAGADTGSWDLHSGPLPPLPPTMTYPTSPATRPYPGPHAGSAPVPPPQPARPVSPPPAARPVPPPQQAQPLPPPPAARPMPPAQQARPVSPAARPVSPPPVARPVSPPVPPPAPARQMPAPARPAAPPPQPPPPQQQQRRPAPTPAAPRAPRRRRRRWPWVLLLSIACCCGCPAYWIKPIWEQYPAKAALPSQINDLSLRQDDHSDASMKRLETEVRKAHLLAEETFAGLYATPAGKRVTVFGGTGFRFTPEGDADDEMTRLKDSYRLGEPQVVETDTRGRHARCAVGALDGADVVVCTSVDHGSLTTGVFTQLSLDDSARLLDAMRERIVTPSQVGGGN
uniref:hypothetical protein n=1 Tax=Micromonospora okii TaxID=1182970 RepID=UPI003570D576